MGCCGQRRAQLQNSSVQRPARITHPTVPAPRRVSVGRPPPLPPSQLGLDATLSIRYLKSSPIRVQGLMTGRSYEFSGSQTIQSVDARDASSLLNTRFFRRA
jgi:hypothetical protein